jgi:hypothetical protein
MRACLIQLGLATLVISESGCTSWSRLRDNQPVPARNVVQVWSDGQEVLIWEPHTVGDSLVGREAHPDTTRITVALSAIDSVRTQETDMGKTLIVGTGVALAVLYAYAKGLNFD